MFEPALESPGFSGRTSTVKREGSVYTPPSVVALVVGAALAELTPVRPVLGVSFLDPSCGDGAFLLHVLALKLAEGGDGAALPQALEQTIIGRDISASAVEECRGNLDRALAAAGMSAPVDWNVRVGDSLLTDVDLPQVDCVVGNPPYVRIQNLGDERRTAVQARWPLCGAGSTDLFIAFFEFGYRQLATGGVLAYITPRSHFSSEAGSGLRQWIRTERSLVRLIDFGQHQLFPGVSTYTAITVLGKRERSKVPPGALFATPSSPSAIRVELRDEALAVTESDTVDLDVLIPKANSKWVLSRSARSAVAHAEGRGLRLDEVCAVRVGLATLADAIYMRPCTVAGDRMLFSDSAGVEHQIETAISRPIMKASTLKFAGQDQGYRVIFPYTVTAGRAALVPEGDLRDQFPLAYQYLQSWRTKLDNRGHDTVAWYAYGSTQGLATLTGPKILFSPLVLEPTFLLDERPDSPMFYSGYGIFFAGDLRRLADRLARPDFLAYCRHTARPYRGGYFSMTKKSIAGFTLDADEWRELGWTGRRVRGG